MSEDVIDREIPKPKRGRPAGAKNRTAAPKSDHAPIEGRLNGPAALPAYYSNEAVAERTARQESENEGYPKVELVADEWKQHLRARIDPEIVNPPNMFDEEAAKHKQPGKAYRWLSQRVINRQGMRGWEPTAHSKTKGQVTVAGMILGEMPQEKADARAAARREQHNRLVRQMKEDGAERLDRVAHESRGLVAPLTQRETDRISRR